MSYFTAFDKIMLYNKHQYFDELEKDHTSDVNVFLLIKIGLDEDSFT